MMNPQYKKTRGLKMSRKDSNLISAFVRDIEGEKGIKARGLHDIEKSLRLWTDLLPLSKPTDQQVRDAVAALRRRKYKPNTLRHHLGKLKQFLIWAIENGRISIDTKTVSRIKVPPPDLNTKKPSQMLNEGEIKKIIMAWRGHPREQAIFSTIYEGSFRPVELEEMVWGDITFDENGVVIVTAKKTGKPRYIRLITSAPYLAAWKEAYPLEVTDDSRVFVAVIEPHGPIGYRAFQHIMRETRKKAGLDKHISLYLFRHSRITNMLQQEYPESAIKLQAWGNLRTPMLATYAHLDGTYMDRVMLDRAGIVKKERKKSEFTPGICPGCGALCKITARFCEVCGHGLTEEAIVTAEKREEIILNKVMERLAAKQG